jgi:hypothetical protein
MRTLRPTVATGLVLAVLLGACAEKRDSASTSVSRKLDDSPTVGASAGYTVAGWKAGDAASWEEQIRTRTQGQNEYAKTGAASR